MRYETDIDLYSDETLANPYPAFRTLRDMAGAVWMKKYEMYILTRFEDVRNALDNWEVFSSSRGIAMNEGTNQAVKGIMLCMDPPEHDEMRKIFVRPFNPKKMRELSPQIESESELLIERLTKTGRFNAANDLARHLPVMIVSKLVGVPEHGRKRMLDWSFGALDAVGPENERCLTGIPMAQEIAKFVIEEATPDKLTPGGWGANLFAAAERGEIEPQQCISMMIDYMAPSLDTTIAALQHAIRLFALHPEQWDMIRENPKLIIPAINEVLRISSPVQGFSRYVTRDHEIDGHTIPEGSRVIVSNASANRDERKWGNPDDFDITRQAMDHVAFGAGTHMCAGNPLARLEIKSILTAMTTRVKRIELHSEEQRLNNVLSSFNTLDVTFHAL